MNIVSPVNETSFHRAYWLAMQRADSLIVNLRFVILIFVDNAAAIVSSLLLFFSSIPS
jgi:hypothetical protein